jgi:hypothetical protein
MTDNTVAALVDGAALLSWEHQLHLAELLEGTDSWGFDADNQVLSFSGVRDLTCSAVHLLGTAAAGDDTWMWSWANPSRFQWPEAVFHVATQVGEAGQARGIRDLATPTLAFTALPGSPDSPRAAAGVVLDAVKPLAGIWTSFIGEVGPGTWAAFLVDHPGVQPPPPEPERILRVVQESLNLAHITDRYASLTSYAAHRGLTTSSDPDRTRLVMAGDELTIDIGFDDLGRVSGISGALGPTR